MAKKTTASETSTEILMLGYLCVKGMERIEEKVNVLDRFGLVDDDIATICACKVQSVRDARSRFKKKGK